MGIFSSAKKITLSKLFFRKKSLKETHTCGIIILSLLQTATVNSTTFFKKPEMVSILFTRIKMLLCPVHYKFSFFVLVDEVTKITKCCLTVFLLFIFLNFRLACLALQNAKTEHIEMKIMQPILGILVALTKKTNLPKLHEINIKEF